MLGIPCIDSAVNKSSRMLALMLLQSLLALLNADAILYIIQLCGQKTPNRQSIEFAVQIY